MLSDEVKDAMKFKEAFKAAQVRPERPPAVFGCPLCGSQVENRDGTTWSCSNHSALKINSADGITVGDDGILKSAKTLSPAPAVESTLTLTWVVKPRSGVATLDSLSFVPVVEVDGGYKHDWPLFNRIKSGQVNYPLPPGEFRPAPRRYRRITILLTKEQLAWLDAKPVSRSAFIRYLIDMERL